MFTPPPFRKGDKFGLVDSAGRLILDRPAANILNSVSQELSRRSTIASAAPFAVADHHAGRHFSFDAPPQFFAKLSGTSSPYSFTQLDGSGLTAVVGGFTGTNAYESNGVTSLGGEKVWLTYEPTSNDWRFQFLKYSNITCYACFTVTGCGGAGTNGLNGATVTLTQSGTPIGSCVTSGKVSGLSLGVGGGGSGFATGTFALGFSGGLPSTVATGTFTTSGGKVISLTLTSGGADYQYAPTLDFSAGGGGGVNAAASIVASCCIGVPAAGTYNYSISATGMITSTGVIGVTCPITTKTVNLAAAVGSCCAVACVLPIPATLLLTDSNTTISLTSACGSTPGWSGCYTITKTGVIVCGPPKAVGSGGVAVLYGFTPIGRGVARLTQTVFYETIQLPNPNPQYYFLLSNSCTPIASVCSPSSPLPSTPSIIGLATALVGPVSSCNAPFLWQSTFPASMIPTGFSTLPVTNVAPGTVMVSG